LQIRGLVAQRLAVDPANVLLHVHAVSNVFRSFSKVPSVER
jgi:hypothetical protein